MNRTIFFISLIVICFSITISVRSQIQFFDSVSVLASSDIYDYKNPVFTRTGNMVQDGWLVYERHNGGTSNIAVRKFNFTGYGPEVLITNSHKVLNINPTISKNILVWQSNARGNWDLFYSYCISNSDWTEPAILDSSSANETNPFIENNNTAPVQYNFNYLVYKRENIIRMKIQQIMTGIWFLDTNLTSGSDEFMSPKLTRGPNGNQYTAIYQKKYSDELSRISTRIFSEPLAIGSIFIQSPIEVFQPNSQNNLTLTNSYRTYITYSYDTLNTKHLIGFGTGGQNFKEIFTKNIPGNHYIGKGSTNTFITDNGFFLFSVFCSLSKNFDSTHLVFINRLNSFNKNPEYKRRYLGDSNVFINFDLSDVIMEGNLYKIRASWEGQLNGKTALYGSYMIDVLGNVSTGNISTKNFFLYQNFPNPFNPNTVINYQLAVNGFTSLKVYDVLGNEVASLVNEKQNAGSHSVEFNGSNLSSGIYFYRIEIKPDEFGNGKFNEIKKMILVK